MNVQNIDGNTSKLHLATRHVVVASGTATYAGVDLNDFVGEIELIVSAFSPVADGSTTLQISLLDSADNSTFATFAGAPTFAPITGVAGLLSASLPRRACRRYVQAKNVVTGTTATFDFAVIGIGVKQSQ